MKGPGFLLCMALLFGCNNGEKKGASPDAGYTYTTMSAAFATVSVPYQLSDNEVVSRNEKDTISEQFISSFIPDSIKQSLGGGKIRYAPLAKIQKPEGETYYIVKAENKTHKAALLLVFEKENFSAALPFLIPDEDATTTQTSSIDKSYSISRNIVRKKGLEILGEGKDVFVYSKETKNFSWVVTDLLDESNEIVNPIDTFKRTNRLSGDYYRNKKNLISVRDGRYPNQLLVYVHTEDGECRGELKGELLITSSNTAVYRHSGDPCILQFTFKGNTVSVLEQQGCGNYRGIDCAFDGTFTLKKIKPSGGAKKNKP